MSRTLAHTAVLAVALGAVALPSAAHARAAEPFRYAIDEPDFSVCGEPASLVGTVSLTSRSTGAENGNYSSTFLESTAGAITIGGDTYRYRQASRFSELETTDGESRTLRLSGSIRLSGSGPFRGTYFEQQIHAVVDARGVTRVDSYVSAFCEELL